MFGCGTKGDGCIGGGHALHGRFQVVKAVVVDCRDQFGSDASARHIFGNDDNVIGLGDGRGDGFHIQRRQRTRVDHFDGNARRFQFIRHGQSAVQHQQGRDDGDIAALPFDIGYTQGNGVRFFRHIDADGLNGGIGKRFTAAG